MWTQIANRFKNYDQRLLFAGTNEVMVEGDYNTPTVEYYTVQNSFNQTFVSAVRATGGPNANRFWWYKGLILISITQLTSPKCLPTAQPTSC